MTVTTNVSEVEYYGDGSTTAFAVPFPYTDETDLVVILIGRATGVANTRTLTTHYTVSPTSGASGTVTFLVAPTDSQRVKIVRRVAITQSIDYVENSAFPAADHENSLDRLTMIAQDLYRQVREGVIVTITSQGEVPEQGAGEGVAGLTNVFVAKITGTATDGEHPITEQEPVSGGVTWQDKSGGYVGNARSTNGLSTDWTNKYVVVFSYEDSTGALDYRFEPPGEAT